jgi:hypothetical protein
MPFEPDKATANVLIDGLSISCFNRQNGIWEVGYLRHPLHDLILEIGNGFDAIHIPREAKVIKLETTKGLKPDYDKEFPDGFFDRDPVKDRKLNPGVLSQDEKHNFRWAMNLDQGVDIPHGAGTLKRPENRLTIAQISDAVFYTNRLSPDNLFLLPLSVDPAMLSTAALDQKVFGKAADEIGAAITCDLDGGITITVDGKPLMQLPHKPGNPWKINLKNMPATHHHGGNHEMGNVTASAADLEQGDFQLYYESLAVSGEKHSFWGVKSPLLSGRTDCNSGWVSIPSLAGLFS